MRRTLFIILAALMAALGSAAIAQQKSIDDSEPSKPAIEDRIDTTAPGLEDDLSVSETTDDAAKDANVLARDWEPPSYDD